MLQMEGQFTGWVSRQIRIIAAIALIAFLPYLYFCDVLDELATRRWQLGKWKSPMVLATAAILYLAVALMLFLLLIGMETATVSALRRALLLPDPAVKYSATQLQRATHLRETYSAALSCGFHVCMAVVEAMRAVGCILLLMANHPTLASLSAMMYRFVADVARN